MNAIIIDNEKDARHSLRRLIELFCPKITISDAAVGVKTGIESIYKHRPDLVFLDVEMDDGTGFELIKAFEDSLFFKVIFTTAYEKYAVQAIRLSAVDFLLKPIDPDELQEAVNKVEKRFHKEEELIKLKALRLNITETSGQRIVLKDQSNIYVVKIEDIVYCAGEGSYTTFYLISEEQIIISKNLKVYEKLLPEDAFFRVHTSYLINLSKIKRIAKGIQDIVVMEDGSEIPVSVRRKADLIKRIG